MKKYKFILFLITISLYCCVYDPALKTISVHNNTDSTIYACSSCTDSITKDSYYDLQLFQKADISKNTYATDRNLGDSIIISPPNRINPYSYGTLGGAYGREAFLSQCPDKKLRVFYISEETMRTKTKEEIVERQLYIKRGIYTMDQLKALDWIITYP